MTQRQPSDCLDENLVYQFVAGKIAASVAATVESHEEACEDCRELIAWARRDLAKPDEETTQPAHLSEGAQATALLAVLRPNPEHLAGQTIAGKYRLGRRLGAGGMGVVYEAVNTWTERRVALKLLHPWFSSDAEIVRRFHLEARNASRIAHPNIVDVFDLGQEPRDGSLYMVQEFLTGPTLRQHIAEHGRVPLIEAAEILRPIMGALAAAHEAGVVHRDVKPENIILSTDRGGQPIPKLIDFGISKITEGDLPAMFQTGRAVGTPLYMSPEQLRADAAIDGRADIWAMGVVLFELLVGRRPFEASSNAEVAARILTSEAPSLHELAPDLPAEVGVIIRRALARERSARFERMEDMIDALAAALNGRADVNAAAHTPASRLTRGKRLIGYLVAAGVAAPLLAFSLRFALYRAVPVARAAPPSVGATTATTTPAPTPPPLPVAPTHPAAPLSAPRPAETNHQRSVATRRRSHAPSKTQPAARAPEPPAAQPAKHARILDP